MLDKYLHRSSLSLLCLQQSGLVSYLMLQNMCYFPKESSLTLKSELFSLSPGYFLLWQHLTLGSLHSLLDCKVIEVGSLSISLLYPSPVPSAWLSGEEQNHEWINEPIYWYYSNLCSPALNTQEGENHIKGVVGAFQSNRGPKGRGLYIDSLQSQAAARIFPEEGI